MLELLTTPTTPAAPAAGDVIPQGQRNDALFRLARGLVARGLTAGAIHHAVAEENRSRCRPALPDREVRALVEHAVLQPHRSDFAKPTQNIEAGANGHAPILVRLVDVEAEPVEWSWPNRIARGKLALIIGEPGACKSHVVQDIAARTTRGTAWPDDGQAPSGAVVVLTSEDGIADTLRPRIDRLGGDPSRVYVLRAVEVAGQEYSFNLERDLPALEYALASTRAALLVIDPRSPPIWAPGTPTRTPKSAVSSRRSRRWPSATARPSSRSCT